MFVTIALGLVSFGRGLAADVDPAALAEVRQANDRCLACHSEAGLAAGSPKAFDVARVRPFLVDPEAFAGSNHGAVKCVTCHVTGFEEFPHAPNARQQISGCAECHARAFLVIEDQFKASVHFKKEPNAFTCVTCHDPHIFLKASHFSTARAAVAQDNAMCLRCHGSEQAFAQVSKAPRPDLKRIHAWLPNVPLHWSAVRCVECHTPVAQRFLSHEIVGADRAERLCVTCHTADSALRVRLYRHLVAEERERVGFINSAILNEAYVVGATRNRILDSLSFVVLGLVVLGLAGHALARLVASRRRRRRNG